ncbi:choice-of-anchor D domain-containing protein [Flavobacterium sp.]|uniref:choice-of-anchor D domain-containing protein n=1 Tax=Flavobacterium sp. TaxID=239 RepID=UPI0025BDCC8E|nr:choice-of-anchor D domain-containing protein [Flavobacterium sp.]MBA4153157.1 hypothetical protein [Flavobacterium sp.]
MKTKLLLLTLLMSAFSWGQSVIISQYIETSSGSYPKGIEIFNVSGANIVFSATNNLQIYVGVNGAACASVVNITSGTLATDQVWVIGTTTAPDLLAYATANGTNLSGTTAFNFTFNGDDALSVYLGGVLQDMFGTCGSDPGAAWTAGSVSTANQNIQIIDGTCVGDTNGWTDPSERFTYVGVGNTDMTGFGNAPTSCFAGCTDPVAQATDIVISNPTTSGYTISWTAGSPSYGTMVVVRQTANPLVAPISGTTYAANAVYGTGANLGSNNFVVYKGTGTSVNVTGLAPGTPYVITIYSYNSPNCYSSTPPESLTRYTLVAEPNIQATGTTSCGLNSVSSVTINFPSANSVPILNCSGYLILMREGAAPTAAGLVDGEFYANNSVVGNATVVAYVNNTTNSRVISGLNAGSTYYFLFIPYGGSTAIKENLNYKVDGTPLGMSCATVANQEINVRGVIGSNPTIFDGDTTPQGTDNTLFATVAVGSSQAKVFRIENTGNVDLTVSNVSFAVATVHFTISPITFPLVIPGGTYYDFTITFNPQSGGVKASTLYIANDDATVSEQIYSFVVQGTGTVTPVVDMNVTGNGSTIPDNSIYPNGTNHTAFGVATVGVTTVVRTFTIENLGSSLLTILGTPLVNISGPHASMFTVTALPSSSIAGSASTTFQVTFNPTSLGAKNATISIFSNDSDENPYNFNISGNAKGANNMYVYGNGNDVIKGAVTTSTTNLTDFGPVAITTGVKQNTFIITNLSGGTRYLSSVSISGPDAAMFSVVSNPTINGLGDGNSTSFTLNFTPTSIGVKNATITFNTYTNTGLSIPEPIDPVFTFAVSGLGTNYVNCANGPVETIRIQDFEAAPATPTWTYTKTYTSDTANNGIEFIGGGTYDNGSGAKNAFIGARSYQFRGFADVGESSSNSFYQSSTLTFTAVNTAAYKNINFSMNVGAFRTGTQGLDVNDFIQVQTSIDGGVNWSTEAVLRGFSNSRWDFAASGVFNAYYTGINTGATVDTRAGNAELANGYATYYVKNLPAYAGLLIRVTIYVDRDNEIWAIDNVKLEGQQPVTSTWTPSAWTPAAPTSSTTAIINGNFNTATHGNFNACNCEIKNGFTVIVANPGDYIEVQTDLTLGTGSTLEVRDDASLVMKNDYGVLTNNGTMRMIRQTSPFKKFDYVYWSSPLNNASLATTFAGWRLDYAFQFVTPNFEDLLTINNLGVVTAATSDTFDDYAPWAWQAYTGVMTPGKGYAIMAPTTGTFPRMETRTFTGVGNLNKFNNGIITVPLALSANATVTTDDYNLVGNPYPSAIFANDFINANLPNISGTIYFWTHNSAISSGNPGNSGLNHTTNDYAMYNLTGSIATSTACSTCGAAPTGYIPSGQGFLVEAENDVTSVVFNNSMRSNTYINSDFYRSSTPSTTGPTVGETYNRIWLNFSNTVGMFSQQLIGYFNTATNDYDKGYDGRHHNALNYVNFYSLIGSDMYRIQGRTAFVETDEVPLGYTTAVAGAFTISSPQQEGVLAEIPVYLEDKVTGILHDLKMSPYTFETAVGTFNDRFVLRYTNTTLGAPDFEAISSQVVAFGSNGLISIKSSEESIASVTVYDILGRTLLTKNGLSVNEVSFVNPSKSTEALLLKITLQNGQVVTRKMVF